MAEVISLVKDGDLDGVKRLLDKLLLQYYPDLLHHPDSEGATPLHYASLNGDAPLAQFLLNQKSKMLQDNNGETPVHLASLNGHPKVVALLLGAGGEVNSVSAEGNTPLHLATINEQHDVIRVLLSHPNVDRGIKTRAGLAAYDIAVKGNNKAVLDAFDDEKRERIVKMKNMEDEYEALQKEKQALLDLVAQEKEKYASVLAKIELVKKEHDEVKGKIDSLSLHTHIATSQMSQEDEEEQLRKTIREQEALNKTLEQSLDDTQSLQLLHKMEIRHRVASVHEALSNILSLVDSYTPVIITTKTMVETVKPHLTAPTQYHQNLGNNNNTMTEGQVEAMDTEF